MTILEAEEVKMPYGVHEGKTLAQIIAADATYIDWLLSVTHTDFYFAGAVALVAEKHGRQAKRSGRRSDSMQGELF